MDRNDANQGNEDNSAAVEHVENAHENRDALAEQARRTEATAGASADRPVGQQNTGGQNSGGSGTSGTTSTGARTASNTHVASEDNSQAVANTSNAHDNLEALRDQNRRTEETTPDAVRRPIGEQNDRA
jgi:hypothetical protein